MYKYLLWDIDGTVLDFLSSEAYAIRFLFKKYNIGECTDQMLKQYSAINTKYWKMLERGEMSKPEILIGRFREFFELMGIDTAIAEDFNRDYQLTLGDHIEFIDTAEEMLNAQKGKYVLAAVTNGTKVAQEKKLRLSGLDNVFDAIFISEDVGYEKPDRKYFNHVFEALNITDKSEVLIIGDSLSGDMKGGYMAGIDTCWFNPSNAPNTLEIPVTYKIETLSELSDIL